MYRKSLEGGCVDSSEQPLLIHCSKSFWDLTGPAVGGSGLRADEPGTKGAPGLGLVETGNEMALWGLYLCYPEPLTPEAASDRKSLLPDGGLVVQGTGAGRDACP